MANENTDSVIVLTRATYDNRKAQGEILNNVIYIVIENSTISDNFLSLYLGEARVTDIISLDELITITAQTDLSFISIPAQLAIKDKLYTLMDNTNNIIRVYGCDGSTNLFPLVGLPMWED